jgi:hypothetical protein
LVGSTLSCEDEDVAVHVQTHAFAIRTGYFAYQPKPSSTSTSASGESYQPFIYPLHEKRIGNEILDTILKAYFSEIFFMRYASQEAPANYWQMLIRIYEINLSRLLLDTKKFRVSSLLTKQLEHQRIQQQLLQKHKQDQVFTKKSFLDDLSSSYQQELQQQQQQTGFAFIPNVYEGNDRGIDWSAYKTWLCPIPPQYPSTEHKDTFEHYTTLNPTSWCEWWSQTPEPSLANSLETQHYPIAYIPLMKWGGTQMKTMGFLCPGLQSQFFNRLNLLRERYPGTLGTLLRFPEVIGPAEITLRQENDERNNENEIYKDELSNKLYHLQKQYWKEISMPPVSLPPSIPTDSHRYPDQMDEEKDKEHKPAGDGTKVCFIIQVHDNDLIALAKSSGIDITPYIKEDPDIDEEEREKENPRTYDAFARTYLHDTLDCKFTSYLFYL